MKRMTPARKAAAAAGLKRYIGAACAVGHTERFTKSGACCECTTIRIRRRRSHAPFHRKPIAAPKQAAKLPIEGLFWKPTQAQLMGGRSPGMPISLSGGGHPHRGTRN